MTTTEAPSAPLTYEDRQRARTASAAATLHALAGLITQDDVPTPGYLLNNFHAWCISSREQAAALVRSAARAGWQVEKVYEDGGGLRRIRIRCNDESPWVEGLVVTEQVCERVQTGTATVEHPAEPARGATDAWTEQVPVFEWRCAPLLAGDGDASAVADLDAMPEW